jgi:hypothetical protein
MKSNSLSISVSVIQLLNSDLSESHISKIDLKHAYEEATVVYYIIQWVNISRKGKHQNPNVISHRPQKVSLSLSLSLSLSPTLFQSVFADCLCTGLNTTKRMLICTHTH